MRIQSAITLIVLAMLSAVLLSTHLLRVRQASMDVNCAERLRQLAIATHTYHSNHRKLPLCVTGTSGDDDDKSNRQRLSGFAALLPFIGEENLWNRLNFRSPNRKYPPMGPAPSLPVSEYPIWGEQVAGFLCPAERTVKKTYGLRSYVFCYGDGVQSVGLPYFRVNPAFEDEMNYRLHRIVCRGMFVPGSQLSFRDITDGLGNTIMYSETCVEVDPSSPVGAIARNIKGLAFIPEAAQQIVARDDPQAFQSNVSLWSVGKGSRWAEGIFHLNAFTTVLPPGSPSATEPGDPYSGVISATSRHLDGVNVLMGDGALRYVSNTIDAGSPRNQSVCWDHRNQFTKSPYGVWGAMGTCDSKEIIPSEREVDFETYGRGN